MTLYCDKCGTRHDSSVCPSCSGLGKSRPMTAPDVNDVRARFEAWCQQGDWNVHNPNLLKAFEGGYRAALAKFTHQEKP